MAGIVDFLPNLDVKGIFSGAGQLIKDIRTAITGKEPIDATKAAELSAKLQELDSAIQQGTLAVALAESQSEDKWTSRGRPMFLYVVYIFMLAAIPMGFVAALKPDLAEAVAEGMGAWLKAIPDQMWYLFGAGYLGYGAFRSWDKYKMGK
ncbi:MAG: hypothetical protein A4E65_02439 [Syntrophorhabdus sp. PtaU1.Bin153]|nr:MAG: hypothetical protein A4E65_02439 [Syntrophorhabdus sp. PtaU1.Bin153]